MALTKCLLAIILVMPLMLVGAEDILYSGKRLLTDQYLENGPYRFVMQGDCNLVLYNMKAGKALWHTNTASHGKSCQLLLQNNGNLVIFQDTNAIWTSRASWGPNNDYILVLQSDGNLVIYGGAKWTTNTAQISAKTKKVINVIDPLV